MAVGGAGAVRRWFGLPPAGTRRQGNPQAIRLAHYLMVMPTLLLLVSLLAVPALYVGWLSLSTSTYGQDPQFIGLANYLHILNEPVFWRAFWNTFFVVNGVVYGELLLGLGLAVLVAGWCPWRPVVIALVLAPYAITETSGIVMWRYLLEPDVGLITQLLARLGLGQFDWTTQPVKTLLLAGIIAVWHHLPFTFLILYSALMTVPREILEAAEMDGATPWQKFRLITLRMIMPAVLIAVLFRYIFAIRMFSEVWLLTEGGPARMSELLAIYLYREMVKYHNFGAASATGWLMLVFSLLIALPYLRRMFHSVVRGA